MKVRFRKTRNACIGAIEIPTAVPGTVIAACMGVDQADALRKAAVLAERIASDPVMSALIPPSALPAIRAARALASAAQRGSGPLRSLWRSMRGPGKSRLVNALHAEAVKSEAADVGAGDWIPAYYGNAVGNHDCADNEVGFLPLAVIAAKYGPAAAKKAAAMYKARKARKKAAAARKKAAAAKAAAREAEAPEREDEPDDEPDEDDNGGGS